MFSKKPFSGVNHVYFKQKLLNYDVVMEDYCVSLGNLIKLTLRKAWWHMIIIDELYFKFVEGEGFRFFFFFSQTQPRFKVSSYTIFITCCYEIFLEEQDKIKKFLKSNYNHRHMDLFAKNNSIFLISTLLIIIGSCMRKLIIFILIIDHKGEQSEKRLLV